LKIRYRLFLVLGALFLVCYFVAVSIQAYVTESSIKEAQQGVVQQLQDLQKERRVQIEDLLASIVAEKISQIETLLMAISSYPPQSELFLDDEKSWQNLGEVLYSNKWLDFLQQTNVGFSNRALLVDPRYLNEAKVIAQAQDDPRIIKVEIAEKEWIGITLPFELLSTEVTSEQKGPFMPFILFTQDQINTLARARLSRENIQNWAPIVDNLESLIIKASTLSSWQTSTPKSALTSSENEEVRLFDYYLQQWIERFDQVVMARLLSELASMRLFAKVPSDANFPQGMVVFSGQSSSGYSLMADDVLFQEIKLEKTPITQLTKEFPFIPYIYTICDENLLIGSSFTLKSGNKNGELIIGICLREIAQDLSREFDMPFFCVLNGKIFLQGTKWDNVLQQFPLEKTGSQDSGIIDIDGKSVFFLKMKPLPGVDLEFVAVNYAEREFAFLDYFETGAKQVLSEISKKMWIVAIIAMILALLFLNRLAKRITEPVSKLATAAGAVSLGKLHEVTLPKIRLDRKDEIHTLYSSFDKMVNH